MKDITLKYPKRKKPREYYYGLDALRFFSAILVTLFHLTWLMKQTSTVAWFGWIGVQIFFVISGFVIANSANNTQTSKFIRSRFMRLYPGAMACAFISLAFYVQYNGFNNIQNTFLLFLRSFFLFPKGEYIATAYWTLPIEMAFYFMISLVLFFRHFGRIKMICGVMTIVSSLYILLYTLYVVGILDMPMLEFSYGIRNVSLLRHGVYFAIGIYFWFLTQGQLSRSDSLLLLLSLVAASLEITLRCKEIIEKIDLPNLQFSTSFFIPVIIFYIACLFLFISICSFRVNLFSNKKVQYILRIAGLATYPLYLLHENIGNWVKFHLIRQLNFDTLYAAILGVLVTLVISIFVSKKIEPRIRNSFSLLLEKKLINSFNQKYLQGFNRNGGMI